MSTCCQGPSANQQEVRICHLTLLMFTKVVPLVTTAIPYWHCKSQLVAHHAKPLRASFGAAPIDGARIGSAAADPGHVGIYLHVVLH